MDRVRSYIQGFYQISASIEKEDDEKSYEEIARQLFEYIIQEYEDNLKGGFADQKIPSDFDKEQLFKGFQIEMEHTDNPMLAIEISMDHLTEISDYYDHLEQMEKEAGQSHASDVVEGALSKCSKNDAKPGRPWCIYKHDAARDNQPKGWPKTYETEEDAKKALKMMHVFGGAMKVTKTEILMALASMGVEVVGDKVRKSDLKKALAKEESKKSLRPPKKWYDKMEKEIKEGNPSYSKEQIERTIGDIWYHKLSDAKRKEIREREGKEYGPADS